MRIEVVRVKGWSGILCALLAAMVLPSGVQADAAAFQVELLLRRVLAGIGEDGHLSQSGYRCETLLPDSGAGGLQECVMPGSDIRSLWIVEERSDAVSLSIVAAKGVESPDTSGDIRVADLNALQALRARVAQMPTGGGIERCVVDMARRADTELAPVVFGTRNWVTGSRITIGLGFVRDAEAKTSDPGEASDIVATLLILNQLDVPCSLVTDHVLLTPR
jgi:hypothetical protein